MRFNFFLTCKQQKKTKMKAFSFMRQKAKEKKTEKKCLGDNKN